MYIFTSLKKEDCCLFNLKATTLKMWNIVILNLPRTLCGMRTHLPCSWQWLPMSSVSTDTSHEVSALKTLPSCNMKRDLTWLFLVFLFSPHPLAHAERWRRTKKWLMFVPQASGHICLNLWKQTDLTKMLMLLQADASHTHLHTSNPLLAWWTKFTFYRRRKGRLNIWQIGEQQTEYVY